MQTTFERLKNGLPVLYAPIESTAAVCVLVLVRIGSRYESDNQRGLSHFLEHMVFKGTAQWPTSQALTHALDSIGAEYNAFTSKEYTGFYVKAAVEQLPLALAVLQDMVWRPKLASSELVREQQVIVEEIKMYEDNPLMHIGDVLENALFHGSTLGLPIAGTQKSVPRLSHALLFDYWQHYYVPQNMLVTVAGKFTSRTKEMVRKVFGQPRQQGSVGKYQPFSPRPKRAQVALYYKDTQQVQLALGFPAFSTGDKRELPLELLGTVLGGNMSSRLFMRLREREGLCYSIRAGSDSYQGTGLFAVQAGLDKARLTLAIKLIREELARTTTELISVAELTKAKEYIRGRLTLAMEDSSSQSEWIGKRYLLEGSRETPEQYVKRLVSVTPAQVKQVARIVFKPTAATLALIGPFRTASPWRKLLA